MPELLCPSCGAEVPLHSAAMPYAVCSYCQSLLLREGGALQSVGTSAVLPFDVSPIMIGTSGKVDGISFSVVGRVRRGWADGAWNEWLLVCADGTMRWLGEAMGQFMLLIERADLLPMPAIADFARDGALPLGTQITLNEITYTAADIKQAKCLGGEGDLPFPAPPDWVITSVDFRSPQGAFLNVQHDTQGTSVWGGRYVDLAELEPSGLRRFDDWVMPKALR